MKIEKHERRALRAAKQYSRRQDRVANLTSDRDLYIFAEGWIIEESGVDKLRMGHYDNCRPENCGICGQLKGHCHHTRPEQTDWSQADAFEPEPRKHFWDEGTDATDELCRKIKQILDAGFPGYVFSIGKITGKDFHPKMLINVTMNTGILRTRDWSLQIRTAMLGDEEALMRHVITRISLDMAEIIDMKQKALGL